MHRASSAIARALGILAALANPRIARITFVMLIASFVIPIALAQPMINEVMPHSNNSWSDEWVELYNPTNDTLALAAWKIGDLSSNDTINLNISAGGFGLIVDNNTHFGNATGCAAFNISNSSCVELTTIGSGLNDDTPDAIFLYDNNSAVVNNFSWSSASGIKSNGTSWSRSPDGNSNWTSCMPTPGSSNNCTTGGNASNASNTSAQNVVLSVNLSSPVLVDAVYAGIFNVTIQNKTNCSFSDNVTAAYNITLNASVVKAENVTVAVGCSGTVGNWTPNAMGVYALCGAVVNSTANNTNASDDSACANITVVGQSASSCDLSVSISAPEVVDLNVSSALDYNISLSDGTCNGTLHAVNVTYRIDDLFGNNVRSPYTSSTSMACSLNLQRSWTPDEIGDSEGYRIKANISAPGCNDTNLANNYAERLFVVKGDNSFFQSSLINITSIDQGSSSISNWGDTIGVWAEIYKGNTSQYAVYAYVRYAGDSTKVSYESTMHALSEYTTYKLKIPVALKPNCGGGYASGNYTLVVEGLGQSANATVRVYGTSTSYCQTITTTTTTSSSSGGGGGGSCPVVNTSANASVVVGEDSSFYFVSSPGEVEAGQPFEVVARLKNTAGVSREFKVYSYVFDGGTLLSEGNSNSTWQGGWDANERSVTLGANESTDITLVNRVKDDSASGTYNLRVRIKDVRDLTKTLKVTKSSSSVSVSGEALSSEAEQYDNVTNNTGQRRTITREDPLEAVKNSIGGFASGIADSTQAITSLIVSKVPKQDPTLILRIVSKVWEGFIWSINRIVTS